MTVADVRWGEFLDEIADLSERPQWHQWAACRGMPSAVFFPDSTTAAASMPAELVCMSCPVIAECGRQGELEADGVWGGQMRSVKTRRDARRQAVW